MDGPARRGWRHELRLLAAALPHPAQRGRGHTPCIGTFMHYRLKADPRIFEKYPHYTALIIYAYDLSNQASNEYSTKLLREAESRQRMVFGDAKPASHPHIAAWRAEIGRASCR